MRTMKDSGLSWVGKIPSDWLAHPVYYYFGERKNKNIFGQEDNLLSLSYGRVIRKDINTNGGLLPESFNTYNIVEAGDIIIRPTDLQNDKKSLRTGLCLERGIITSAYIALRPIRRLNSGFFRYLLHAYDISKVFYNMGNGVRQGLNFSEFSRLMVFEPPIEIQDKITQYLDTATAKVDEIISDIQTQIDTLEQYKRSIITETVTKGLNPDAEMKDSGIQWVGQMPLAWDAVPNKYLMYKVKNICPVYNGEDILSLTTNGVIIRDLNGGGKMPTSFDGYQKVTPGNLLMCLFDIDVTPRCIGLVKNFGLTSPAYSQFVIRTGAYAPYYYYYYLMVDYTKELLHMSKNLRHSLTEDQLGAIKAPNPPYEEQVQIAEFLDKECVEISRVIEDKNKQLATLDEYKKSLIFEYVTGKKEIV